MEVYCREDTPESDDSCSSSQPKYNGHEKSNGTNVVDDKANNNNQNENSSKYPLNSLPKYIFEANLDKLKSVDKILKQTGTERLNDCGEVSDYPIEYYERQQQAIERHMSVR